MLNVLKRARKRARTACVFSVAVLCAPIHAADSSDVTVAIAEAIEEYQFADYRETLLANEFDQIQGYVHALNTETRAVTKQKVEEWGITTAELIGVHRKHGVLTEKWFESVLSVDDPSDPSQTAKISATMLRATRGANRFVIGRSDPDRGLIPFRYTFAKKGWLDRIFD